MTNCLFNKWTTILVWPVLFFSLTYIFYTETMYFKPDFSKESEALVIGRIVLDKFMPNSPSTAMLGAATSDRFSYDTAHITEGYTLLTSAPQNIQFQPYLSQVGLQGWFYSAIYNDLGFAQLKYLNLLCSLLTAISLLFLTWGYSQSLGNRFAVIFLVSTALSPWVVAFSNNLYWSPFLWFAPAGFAVCAYLCHNKWCKYACLLMVLMSVFIKSLCGYEYISTIIWFSCAIFLLDPFLPNPRFEKTQALKYTVCVFSLGVIGFMLALLVHANLRADSLSDGIVSIFEHDVKRRTYGAASSFAADKIVAASLTATPSEVLKMYFTWKTPLLISLPSLSFMILTGLAMVTLLYKFTAMHISRWRDFGLFFIFAFGPISWFVLAKSHSYVHPHLNFVLWYFGFVAAILYISVDGIIIFSRQSYQSLAKHFNFNNKV